MYKSYCYTQLCNYREEFVFKPISNQLNILVGCNLNGWIIFSRLNTIKEFVLFFIFKLKCCKFVALKENTLTLSFRNYYSKHSKHPPQGFPYGEIRMFH